MSRTRLGFIWLAACGPNSRPEMKIAIFETAQCEREACLRLGVSHVVTCTGHPLNERTAGEHPDAEAFSPFVRSKAQCPSAEVRRR